MATPARHQQALRRPRTTRARPAAAQRSFSWRASPWPSPWPLAPAMRARRRDACRSAPRASCAACARPSREGGRGRLGRGRRGLLRPGVGRCVIWRHGHGRAALGPGRQAGDCCRPEGIGRAGGRLDPGSDARRAWPEGPGPSVWRGLLSGPPAAGCHRGAARGGGDEGIGGRRGGGPGVLRALRDVHHGAVPRASLLLGSLLQVNTSVQAACRVPC